MGNYFGNAGSFLIDTIIGLYMLAVMLRFLLQWVGADFYNPISQFLVAVTNPPLTFLRKLIPGLFGIDIASLVLLVALAVALLAPSASGFDLAKPDTDEPDFSPELETKPK